MAGRDRTDTPQTSLFLLLWQPPGRTGRYVVGGWALESWRGGSCVWAMELAGLGAYFWVDAELAKVVAARVLRGHQIPEARWLPSGGDGGPVFLAREAEDGPGGPVIAARPTTAVLEGHGPHRPASRAGVSVT